MNPCKQNINHGVIFMIRVLLFVSLFSIHVLRLCAQEIAYARKVVEDMAGPAMQGRGFVHKGMDKAAKYLIKEFRKNGAMPVNGSYSQWFRINMNTFPGPVKLSVNDSILKPGIDYLPDPSSPGIKGSFHIIEINTKDILTGNSRIIMQQAKQNQLLYLNLSETNSLDNIQKKTVKDFREQLKRDGLSQASGIIELTNEKLTWNSSAQCIKKPWIILNKTVFIDSLTQLKVNIKNRMISGGKTRNTFCYYPGNIYADSFIVFTAHYDHIGSLGKKTFFPGANDNASGVAMLLSLMKYYASHPTAYSLLFLTTSAEELGLTGARYFVDNPAVELNKIRFLINFDLVGTGEEGVMVVNANVFPHEFKTLISINDKDSLLHAIKTRGEACNSDHCPFYLKGVPCFFIYTLGGNASYHDLFDTPEALSMAAFENYARLIIKFIEKLSQNCR